jgi:predicted acyltransferase
MAGSSVQSLYVRVLWRSAALVLLGVVLNAFPTFDWGSVRIPGVLQRIGLCYGLVGALMLTFSEKSQQGVAINLRALVIAVLILLLSYWALLSFVAAPGALAPAYDSVNSLPAYVDRQIFGLQHLWPYGTTDGKVTYDPEGLLSTLPACINVIIGALVTCIYQRNASKSNASLALIAVSLLVLGLLLGTFFPIIKKIWSSSFALFSSGVSVALLVVINQCRFSIKSLTPSYPIHVFGANALLAFAVSTIIGSLMDFPVHILGQETSVRSYGFNLFLAMVGNPQAASFLY